MKKIKPPFLSTSFSESGKSAKRRLANILNSKAKKVGVALVTISVIFVGAAGASVAVRKNMFAELDEPTLYDEAGILFTDGMEFYLSSFRHENLVGTEADEQYNRAIDLTLEISRYLGEFTTENRTDAKSYGRVYHFETPFELMGEERSNDIMEACAITMIALVGDLEYVEWSYPGLEGGKVTKTITAEEADDRMDRELKKLRTELDLHYLSKATRIYQLKGDFGYYTWTENKYFESIALRITPDGLENKHLLDIFLRALDYGVPTELRFVWQRGDNKIMGIVKTDGIDFWFDSSSFDIDSVNDDNIKYYFNEWYTGLEIRRHGERADFYLTSENKEPNLLFSIEEGEEYEEAIY